MVHLSLHGSTSPSQDKIKITYITFCLVANSTFAIFCSYLFQIRSQWNSNVSKVLALHTVNPSLVLASRMVSWTCWVWFFSTEPGEITEHFWCSPKTDSFQIYSFLPNEIKYILSWFALLGDASWQNCSNN